MSMKAGKHIKKASSVKSTKRALIAGAVCTILCAMMLFSGTIAWFSVNKESGINELHAGNLDVKLSYSRNMNAWDEVSSTSSDIFNFNKDGSDFLWEPGAVNVVYFKIENMGSLGAQYSFSLLSENEVPGTNFSGASFKLSDYIQCGVVNGIATAFESDADALNALNDSAGSLSSIVEEPNEALLNGTLSGTSGSTVFALVLYMPNDTQDTNFSTNSTPPSVGLKVKLVANQTVD